MDRHRGDHSSEQILGAPQSPMRRRPTTILQPTTPAEGSSTASVLKQVCAKHRVFGEAIRLDPPTRFAYANFLCMATLAATGSCRKRAKDVLPRRGNAAQTAVSLAPDSPLRKHSVDCDSDLVLPGPNRTPRAEKLPRDVDRRAPFISRAQGRWRSRRRARQALAPISKRVIRDLNIARVRLRRPLRQAEAACAKRALQTAAARLMARSQRSMCYAQGPGRVANQSSSRRILRDYARAGAAGRRMTGRGGSALQSITRTVTTLSNSRCYGAQRTDKILMA